ncbi:MAG: two-component system, cell cycle response regulator DivK [Parcubacteria bacterium C7867-007]|nr:MAG: two-component system, cell cycle response regulator DivK [Parcubacteria bacterium C7867-007]
MKKLLVVDDNQAAADGLVRLLNALGWDASALYTGKEVLEHVRIYTPDLVFIDIGMPDMSGHDVIVGLRAHGFTFPAVALTGYGQAEDKEKALAAGFNAHLTKPAGMEEFKTVLAELL